MDPSLFKFLTLARSSHHHNYLLLLVQSSHHHHYLLLLVQSSKFKVQILALSLFFIYAFNFRHGKQTKHPSKTPNYHPMDLDVEQQATLEPEERDQEDFDYSKRSQWLRAAVLGASDGLVSTGSLIMGVGAVKQDVKAMILSGFAGLVAGACSMAIGEFVSVYSQLDIELAQMKRENNEVKENLPNPLQAAGASALAFAVGAMVPLLAASFIRDYRVRLGVVVTAVSLALAVFGWLGAVLGKAPAVRPAARILIGGWLAMAITFGLTKLIGSSL